MFTPMKSVTSKPKQQSLRHYPNSKGVIQRFYTGYYPTYPSHIEKNPNIQLVNNYVDSLTHRPGWYSTTLQSVLENTPSQVAKEYYRDLSGQLKTRDVLVYECASCHTYVPYAAIDIGHIMPWKNYLKMVGAVNAEEAKIAYNEIGNLQVQCRTCNTSHDYE